MVRGCRPVWNLFKLSGRDLLITSRASLALSVSRLAVVSSYFSSFPRSPLPRYPSKADKMKLEYPPARRDETVKETHFGVEVADPYRWLEEPDSNETQEYIEAQNKVTQPFLDSCKARSKLHDRLVSLWDYPKFSCPYRHGDRHFYYKNSGLQNQSVMYVVEGDLRKDEAKVFLDPNQLSEDGTVSVSRTCFSHDENIMAYSLSSSGSDWLTIHFRDVATGQDYDDVLEKVKFTSVSWTHDNLGVFYSRYPDSSEKCDGSETTSNKNNKLYYHRLKTKQSEDILCVQFPEEPNYIIDGEVSDCGRYLIVTPRKQIKDNLVYYCDLDRLPGKEIHPNLPLTQVIHKFEADYEYITNDGTQFIFKTNKNAPNYRLIRMDLEHPQEDRWKTIVEEDATDVLNWAVPAAKTKLVLCYIHNVKSVIRVHSMCGELIRSLPLDLGTVTGFSSKRKYDEIFYQFTSFLTPGIIYSCDLSNNDSHPQVYREIKLKGFDCSQYEQKQVFYPSKDGTLIPMFIINKKGLVRDGSAGCLLYGYGGFNHPLLPVFSLSKILWMQNLNGVVAYANIRGGGEFGEKWHNGGRLLNKQNTFDDFQSAGDYLVKEKYTKKSKLCIEGGSNGGLLVAACLNQRPDLFQAGVIHVGVLDMLRYHKFTIGAMWMSDYGNPEEEQHFKNLIKFSPLHNIPTPAERCQYPSSLLLTADHDDRVVPLHSLKFIAQLQYTYSKHPDQENPLLIRVDTKAGHGGGKPTSKTIDEITDVFSFFVNCLGLEYKD